MNLNLALKLPLNKVQSLESSFEDDALQTLLKTLSFKSFL